MISSPMTTCANTGGPGRNSNSCVWLRKMLTPVRSLGSRSGVNWMRPTVQSMVRASALARVVLPTPGGTSSSSRCPLGEQDRERDADELGGAAGHHRLDAGPHLCRDVDDVVELARRRHCLQHDASLGGTVTSLREGGAHSTHLPPLHFAPPQHLVQPAAARSVPVGRPVRPGASVTGLCRHARTPPRGGVGHSTSLHHV